MQAAYRRRSLLDVLGSVPDPRGSRDVAIPLGRCLGGFWPLSLALSSGGFHFPCRTMTRTSQHWYSSLSWFKVHNVFWLEVWCFAEGLREPKRGFADFLCWPIEVWFSRECK